MTIKSKASAMPLVIAVIFFLTVLMWGYWNKTSLFFDLVKQREIFYKNFYLTEAALDYGLKYCKNNFEILKSKKKLPELPVVLNVDFLFMIRSHLGEGLLDGTECKNISLRLLINRAKINQKVEKKLWLKAILLDKVLQKDLCQLSCKLSKESFFNESTQKICEQFIVQNFTISNFI